MAHASFCDIFLRLPPSAVVLFLASILGTTDGHALPRQTKTVELHELNVVSWPLLPTEPPISLLELQRRQENAICGYVGGDLAVPATCGPGSHCVLDTENKIVGCCPDGGSCSTGVFTGCVDGNSDPQTEVNPYVYTCQGADVCYQNSFAGGYSQFGCGTASELATTVQTSVDGITSSLDLPKSSVGLTLSPSSLSEPTTIGSTTKSATTKSSSTDSTTTSSSTTASTSSPTESSSSSGVPTDAPPTSSDGNTGNRTGAIIGGTLGAVAGLFIMAGFAFFLLRGRQGNSREGPGPAPRAPPTTEYTSPIRSHGAAFAPLPSWQEDQGSFYGSPYDQQQQDPESTRRREDDDSTGNYNTAPVLPPPQPYDPVHVAGIGTGLTPVQEEETHHGPPATRGTDDFSRAYSDPRTGQVPDDDTQPLTEADEQTSSGSENGPGFSRGGNRPLWQQNRQRGRNPMWT